MSQRISYDILGIGTPLLDHLLPISKEYLDQVSGEKYGMEAISFGDLQMLIQNSGKVPKQIAGGSCSNALKGLAALGHSCAIRGRIGKDPTGQKIIDDLNAWRVLPLVDFSDSPTDHVLCLITPDGKRTCRTFLSASMEMRDDHLYASHFNGVKLVHIEGYMLMKPGVAQRAMELAKASKALVSFDLGSFELMNSYKKEVFRLLEKHVDIVFGNKDEMEVLTGKDPKESAILLSKWCQVVVTMMGEKGCYVGENSEAHRYPAFPVNPIDTTGAGDLFASGFLHGILLGKPLEICATWGALVASHVVQTVGSEIPSERWTDILKELSS